MVITVPCLQDNYAYVIEDGQGGAAVVDPSEAGPVQRALAFRGVKLRAIWNTHHHWDHVGGNEELAVTDEIQVIASRHDQARVPRASKLVDDGDTFDFGPYRVRVIAVPGHTLGAIAFVLEEAGEVRAVFTGDTMFAAGCGRLFEGTPEMMHGSLTRLMQLPAATHVFPGHEYTVKNLEFALALEPESELIEKALAAARGVRERGLPTVPSTLERELATNPFVRVGDAAIRAAVGLDATASDVEVLAAVRSKKDIYK